MATKRALITSAFGDLGLASYVFALTDDQIADAKTRMDRMAAQWDGLLIRLGYDLSAGLDDDSGLPDTAEECFSLQLALRLAPTFGKMLAPETKGAARNALNALLATNAKRPQSPRPPFMPIGAGNRRSPLNQQYFPDPGDEVEGINDGATEY